MLIASAHFFEPSPPTRNECNTAPKLHRADTWWTRSQASRSAKCARALGLQSKSAGVCCPAPLHRPFRTSRIIPPTTRLLPHRVLQAVSDTFTSTYVDVAVLSLQQGLERVIWNSYSGCRRVAYREETQRDEVEIAQLHRLFVAKSSLVY